MGFGKDGKGAILRESGAITLSTLAANTALKDASPLAITEDFRIIKSQIFVQLEGDADGPAQPLIFGICSDELSVTEISECIEAEGPLDREDRLKVERAERPVFEICQFDELQSDAITKVPNNGMPIEKVLRWTFSNTSGWSFFVYNFGSGACVDGGVVRFRAKHYGVWVT